MKGRGNVETIERGIKKCLGSPDLKETKKTYMQDSLRVRLALQFNNYQTKINKHSSE